MRFTGLQPQDDRDAIRELRSTPPGLINSAGTKRRQVFRAALEQWDELLEAGMRASAATAPILLFYALTQAGRAIAAAHVRDGWEHGGHGLRHRVDPAKLALTSVTVEPGGQRSVFHNVMRVLGEPPLTGAVTLGAVWAGNVKLRPSPALGAGFAPALTVSAIGKPDEDHHRGALTLQQIGLRSDAHHALVRKHLAGTLEAYEQREAVAAFQSVTHSWPDTLVEVMWERDGDSVPLNSVTGTWLGRGSYTLAPRLNEEGDSLGQFANWWVVLFSLSNLARYEPGLWRQALDLDGSTAAVPLQEALAIAAELLPRLVLLALRGEPLS